MKRRARVAGMMREVMSFIVLEIRSGG